MNNIVSNINEIIEFGPDFPLSNIKNILDWEDLVEGETENKYFERTFSYTLDYIHWTPFILLTTENLNNIPIESTFDFGIIYRYQRKGTDVSGDLEFKWVNLIVEKDNNKIELCKTNIFQQSIFFQFFQCCCEEDVLKWCVNVLNKIYKPGIVSLSLTRSNNINNSDRDYIDFWRSICCYFALTVAYARKFENFDKNKTLLIQYLRNKTLFVSDNDEYEDLIYLMNNIHQEINNRGNIGVFLRSNEDFQEVNGELLRLINNDINDEFLYNLIKLGWYIDNNSIMYNESNFNKLFNKEQYKIDGMYLNDYITPNVEELINVDPSLSYKLEFVAKNTTSLTVSIFGYTKTLLESNPNILSPTISSNIALDNITLTPLLNGHLVQIIIFPFNYTLSYSNNEFNSLLGFNLKFNNFTQKIYPLIQGDNGIEIENLSLKPNIDYSLASFIGGRMVDIFLKNNGSLSNSKLELFVKNYLISFNTGLKINYIK